MKKFNSLFFLALILSSNICHSQNSIYANNIKNMMRFYDFVSPEDDILTTYGLKESDRDAVKEIIRTQDMLKILLYMKPLDFQNLIREKAQDLKRSRREKVSSIMNIYGIDEDHRSTVESLCEKANYEGDLTVIGDEALKIIAQKNTAIQDNSSTEKGISYVRMGQLRSEDISTNVASKNLIATTVNTKLIDYFMAVLEALNSKDYALKELPKLRLMSDKDLVLRAINEMSMELIDEGHLSGMSVELLYDQQVKAKMISVLNARSQKGIFDAIKEKVQENSKGLEVDPRWEDGLRSARSTVLQYKQTINDYVTKKLTEADITALIDDGVLNNFASNAKTSKDVIRIEALMEKISLGFELNADQTKIVSDVMNVLEPVKERINTAQFIKDGRESLRLYTTSAKDVTDADLAIKSMELAEKGLRSSAASAEYKKAITAFIRPESAYFIGAVADKYNVADYSTYMLEVAELVRKASVEFSLKESLLRVETLRSKLEEFRDFRENKVLIK